MRKHKIAVAIFFSILFSLFAPGYSILAQSELESSDKNDNLINWMTLEEAVLLQEQHNKKILLHILYGLVYLV